jgi:CubicO group peptidase (beta-lactamase class C family)
MKQIILLSIALFTTLALGDVSFGQQPGPGEQPTRGVTQQLLASYADKLEARLKNRSVGFSFTIAGSGNNFMISRAGGDARRAPDSGTRKMTADDKFNIASVSKTITAAAVMKLLNEKNISVDSSVKSYLPPNWALGPNFDSITFRQLLTHRSGIRCDGEVTYQNLKICVAGGVNLRLKPVQTYNNSNYALFRFIIPRLNGYPTTPVKIDESKLSGIYAKLYADYVKQYVFAPLGLSGIDLRPAASNPGLAYQYPTPVQAGESFGDMTETSGSRGWNMSSKQLAIFLYNLLNTEKILPRDVSRRMKSEQLGLWKVDVANGLVDYEHGGYYPGKRDDGTLFNGGEMNTLIANFSNGVNVAIIVNSQYGPGLSAATAAREAMKEALK